MEELSSPNYSNSRVMSIIACMLILLSVVEGQVGDIQVIGPVQEFHTCVGTSTYIPWPLNVISRTGHKTTKIYLTFQRRHSEIKSLAATFSGQQELTIDSYFKDRLSVSSEHSGIFLAQTMMDDAGIYTAQARVINGQVWTRTTNLTVLLRPMVLGGRLNISKSEVMSQSGGRSNCINLTCGTLEYAGYPPVMLVWTTTSKVLSMTTATDDFVSSMQICSPYFGEISCSIAGFSSTCIYDHLASVHVDLPEPPSNRTAVTKAAGAQDLALTIVMPILAVLVPLTILGVWVLSHILKSYPHYRDQRHFGDREPHVEIDIEENGITEHTHDNDGQSEEENDQTQIKDDVGNSCDESSHVAIGNNNLQHQLGGVVSVNVVLADDIGDDDEGKINEDKPLMNVSVSTTV